MSMFRRRGRAERRDDRRSARRLSRDPLSPGVDEDHSLYAVLEGLAGHRTVAATMFIPMGWGAPQGAAVVVRQSVAIVPDVAGEVTEVPVTPNTPLKAGHVLFRIDPVPYASQLDALQAQLRFEELRLSQMTQLQTAGTGRSFDVEQRQADVDKLKAQ